MDGVDKRFISEMLRTIADTKQLVQSQTTTFSRLQQLASEMRDAKGVQTGGKLVDRSVDIMNMLMNWEQHLETVRAIPLYYVGQQVYTPIGLGVILNNRLDFDQISYYIKFQDDVQTWVGESDVTTL